MTDEKSVLTVCQTCSTDDWKESQRTAGEALADEIDALSANYANVKVRRFSCLMGCKQSCTVAVQGKEKMTYTLGRFEPTKDAAEGILEYASLHAQSEKGVVAYRQWPQAIKGHFMGRIPVIDAEE